MSMADCTLAGWYNGFVRGGIPAVGMNPDHPHQRPTMRQEPTSGKPITIDSGRQTLLGLCMASILAGLMVAAPAEASEYRWQHTPGAELALRAGEKTIWAYHYQADGGFPYIHPIATSDGTCLTGLAPDDHPWHRAVWFSWKYLDGVNYWDWADHREQPVPAGRTVPVGEETVTLAKDRATIEMNLHYRSDGRTVLKENREILVRVPRDDGSYTID
ncbi:MAG TPA: DUF6807 family protein, partial [Thermoguttaceae bacterium]|nr:DUF6807 family protein [Thermoguttaceae bacterium]